MSIDLRKRSFLTLLDFEPEELDYLLDLSFRLKEAKKSGKESPCLQGKNIVLIFEKPSTRTRCAFEVAAYDQGANVTYLAPGTGAHLGKKESIKDTARVLGRMYDAIEYRGFGQERVETLARYSGVPVWNGLTDQYHPTQVLADLMTMREVSKRPLSELSLCYLGDGSNNVANSLLVGCAKMGVDFRIAAPRECQPEAELIDRCRDIANTTGSRITITGELEQAVKGVDFLYTDVWVSMGQPSELWEKRISLLKEYQVNRWVMEKTGNPEVKFLHCLPALHDRYTEVGAEIYERYGLDGLEVTDEVFESEASLVFLQAENRVHTIKAVMVATLGD